MRSQYHNVTMFPCRIVTLSQCHSVVSQGAKLGREIGAAAAKLAGAKMGKKLGNIN